ncbi:hypothetical protein BT96DRAFT_841316, partial [Gymnopus androsaceus JB14]
GLLPTAPLAHTYAVTVRTMQLYHTLFCRCPKIGMQPFAKTLCNLARVPFKPHMSTQLSTAFNVYCSLIQSVRQQVQVCLGRDDSDWRVLNSCPPCQYQLKEDGPLDIRMIVEMDGNDSLRCVERRGDATIEPLKQGEEEGVPRLGPLKERKDPRVGGGDYFLSRDEVNLWAKENWEDVSPKEQPVSEPKTVLEMLWEEGRCKEQWNNMKEKSTARSVGRFYEWGWFVLLCRHMFLLLACDMIRSGEQNKYPLACLHKYMSAEKEQRIRNGEGKPTGSLGCAYDCGCKLGKSVSCSPLQELALWACFLPMIGLMHGYGHEWLCQLLFLMLYIAGTGLKDGEGCEHYFSIMNALAGVTHHMSVFHRRQAIAEVAYAHDHLETYANVSRFIYNNYHQSLEILGTRNALSQSMVQAGIRAEDFFEWLEEEGNYLCSLTRTPPSETLEMEYCLKLELLSACQDRLKKVREVWKMYKGSGNDMATTRSTETKHRNEQENERKLIANVQALESKLGVTVCWKEGLEEWEAAKTLVKEHEYRKALDKLEGLLVSHIFEMSRLNVAGTGYKMRKHLANALKSQSKSIKAAIEAYNAAACALSPPCEQLSWDKILEFSFLSEFDILQDARTDVRTKKWATQKNHLLMQQFFKLLSAETELTRLHTEIRRMITYMEDEEETICLTAERVGCSDPALALQIKLHGNMRSRFNRLHWQRFWAITKLKGFQRENMVNF